MRRKHAQLKIIRIWKIRTKSAVFCYPTLLHPTIRGFHSYKYPDFFTQLYYIFFPKDPAFSASDIWHIFFQTVFPVHCLLQCTTYCLCVLVENSLCYANMYSFRPEPSETVDERRKRFGTEQWRKRFNNERTTVINYKIFVNKCSQFSTKIRKQMRKQNPGLTA